MSGFRIGRKHAQHVYPSPRATTTVPYARNFASGPDEDTPIVDETVSVPWSGIESGAAPGILVPITRLSTGRIRISGVLTIAASTPGAVIQVQVWLTPPVGPPVMLTVPFAEANTVPAGAVEAIPFLTVAMILAGTYNVEIRLISTGAASLIERSSTLELLEVPVATG